MNNPDPANDASMNPIFGWCNDPECLGVKSTATPPVLERLLPELEAPKLDGSYPELAYCPYCHGVYLGGLGGHPVRIFSGNQYPY